MDTFASKMSRRKQSNPKPSKRQFCELLVELAKTLNLPEDLILKSRRPACNTFNSLDSIKDDQLVNGSRDDEQTPKESNDHVLTDQSKETKNSESNNAKEPDNLRLSCKGESIDDCIYEAGSCNSVENSPKSNNSLNIEKIYEINKVSSDSNINESNRCNQDCCALFSIYTQRKLIKGQRFGPYLVHELSTDDLRESDSKDSNDKENQFNQEIDFYQSIQEPAGFWLKIARESSNPTASVQIQEKELWLEILDDLDEGSELCLDQKYQFKTISKSLNRLNTTTTLTDEMLDTLLQENGSIDKTEEKKLNELDCEFKDESNHSDQLKDASLKDRLKIETKIETKNESSSMKSEQDVTDVDSDRTDSLAYVCKLCDIRFSSKNTLYAHQNYYCVKRPLFGQSDSINETLKMLASGLLNRQREKRAINGTGKRHQSEEMCNNTGRDHHLVSGNSQQSNDVSSDSDELEKTVDGQEEQMNNSNNSSVSLGNLTSAQNQSIDLNNGTDATNTARFLQTMNLLLSTLTPQSNTHSDEQPQLNSELLESIQRILGQNGNQNLANSLLSAAAQQRANMFVCKFCTFAASKRQQLIKHVRTNCEGLLNAVASLQSTSSHSTSATTTSSTNSTNTATNCGSPTGEQPNDDSSNAAQLLNSTTAVMAAALSADQMSTGCGNLVCVNSNCTNGNSCVILPNTGNLLNSDKFKSIGQQTADDSEDDLMNSANPQDRYCMECEIQFASYKNYKVHKQIYCGSRHCSQKIQQAPVNINSRKRTISDTLACSSSLSTAALTSSVNNITSLLASTSPPPSKTLRASQSPQQNLFTNQSQLSNLCKSSSLNASASEAGSPTSIQQAGNNLQASMAGLNSNIPLSLSSSSNNMNAHQTALLNELFANGNIINLSTSLNIIQQLSQPVYIAISTNPLILLPINSALGNTSSANNSQTTNSSTNTTTTTSPSNNKLTTATGQDAEQLLSSQLNGILNQAVLESFNKANTNAPRTGDEPIDLSSKRQKTSSGLSSVVSLLEQQEHFANNPQLLKSISIEALNALNSNQNVADVANAFLLPQSLSSLTAKQQLRLLLNQQPRIYSCGHCQIDFHKQENYAIHKKYYCSATKLLLEQAQKNSPTPTDDLETANHLMSSGPNSPQSNQSQQILATNRASAASNSSNSNTAVSLVDTFNQVSKKTSTSSAATINVNSKNSGCVSPSMSNSPVGSPQSFINSNPLTSTASSTITPAQPIYKHYCNKCGIRFTSKDNLHAHQTYYCMSNNLNGLTNSTIATLNSASGLMEVKCPKCRVCYCSEETFLAHVCSANISSQVSTVNSSSAQTPPAGLNTSANNLIDALSSLESLKQQQTFTKLTSSLLGSAVSNPQLIANNSLALSNTKSNNNNQAFKCTICGYKGHTLRGMKTHVRVHGDQLQGAQEESFIIPLSDDCCAGVPLMVNGNCTNANCRNTRSSNLSANKRRRSTDPMQLLSNFVLPNSTTNNINKELLLANSLNPLLSTSLMNGLMGNIMNNLTNHLNNHLVSGLVGGSNLAASSSNTIANDGLSSTTSEAEDNLDNIDSNQNNSTSSNLTNSATCNGTVAVALSSSTNSSNNIGKC